MKELHKIKEEPLAMWTMQLLCLENAPWTLITPDKLLRYSESVEFRLHIVDLVQHYIR